MLCARGVYCLCDEAAQFKQEQEPGHSRGKVVVVHRGLRPSLRCALVVVATVVAAMMAMATTAAAATTREVALRRRGNAMAMCDSDKARMCAANNAGAGTTTEQFACTCAALWGRMRVWGLLGPLKCLVGGVRRPQWPTHLCLLCL